MNRIRRFAGLTALLLATTSTATAQTGRGFVSVNGGTLNGSQQVRQPTQNFDHALFGPERGSFESTYPAGGGTVFDVAGGVRVWRQLAVGGGVSRFRRQDDLHVTAQLPHPFRFRQPRTIATTESGVTRDETAVHLQVMWAAAAGRSVEVALFGGPSFFVVAQDVATGVTFSQTYPYDSATFDGVRRGKPSEAGIGFNAGADLGYYFSRHVGAGGTIRFTRATVELGGAAVEAGGLLASAGLRVRF